MSESMVEVYLNEGISDGRPAFSRLGTESPIKPTDEVRKAITIDGEDMLALDWPRDANVILNNCYRIFNGYPESDAEGRIAAAYRHRGNRSLSVGDVIVVLDHPYVVAGIGFLPCGPIFSSCPRTDLFFDELHLTRRSRP